MRTIYIETSVWSFAFAEDAPDYTAETLRFFDRCRGGAFRPYISGVVLREIARAGEPTRRKLVELIEEMRPLQVPPSLAADELAKQFLTLGAVPPSKPEDAAHVAAAFVSGCDVLVSWNFKHIVNIRKAEKFNAIAMLCGFTKGLAIATPLETWDVEEDA
jgi:predicted nucleic acid-binding protein